MTDRPIRVCLIQHSTRSDNLGVGALGAGEVEILRRISAAIGRPIAITAMDWKDPRAPYLAGPDIEVRDLDSRTMVDPRGYFAEARRSDVVIDIGGGDSFADIYGSPRLKRMVALKYLTHLAGTPLVMAPQTIGPFTGRVWRRLARDVLNRAALVATRDDLSVEAACDLGVRREIVAASDVALRLPWTPPAPRDPGGPVRIGINVSGLLMAGGYTGSNQFGLRSDYPALVRTLIRHFQSLPEASEVHLVAHVIATPDRPHREDDLGACRSLAREFPGTVLAPAFASPSDAKSYIAGLDFFMGARMHACIAAFSTGVPVVPMAYSRKFRGFFGALGYDWTVDCTQETADAVFTRVVQAFAARDRLKRDAAQALERGQARLGLYETALAALLRQALPDGPSSGAVPAV